MPTLGRFIQRRRSELGLTQEQLAELVGDGVRQAEISRLERDRVTLPRRQRLEQIARALDVPLGELLVRSGWAGADTIDDMSMLDLEDAELLRMRNQELEARAQRLESTVDVLASTNVALRSQLIELELESRRQEQEQEFLLSVLDGVVEPIAVLDEAGEVVSENAAFIELRENQGLTRMMTPDGHPIADAISSFRPSERTQEFTVTIVVLDQLDNPGWYEVFVRPITLEAGQRFSVITVKECEAPGTPGGNECAEGTPEVVVGASD